METRSKSFRLSDEDIAKLDAVASARGCNQTEALRWAIRRASDEVGGRGGSDGGALEAQIAAKDGQIDALLQALDHAQMLHAQTLSRPALPEAAPAKKKGGKRRKGKARRKKK